MRANKVAVVMYTVHVRSCYLAYGKIEEEEYGFAEEDLHKVTKGNSTFRRDISSRFVIGSLNAQLGLESAVEEAEKDFWNTKKS